MICRITAVQEAVGKMKEKEKEDVKKKLSNSYLKTQIQNQILSAGNFVSICKMSALKDDGIIDKEEEKLLKKLAKITDDYTKALDKLI